MFSAMERWGARLSSLLYDGDAAPVRLARRQRQNRLAVDEDLPAVGRERARQQVDQRALARAIFAEQSVDAAGDELDRDIAKHGVAEESLRDVPRSEGRMLYAHVPYRAAFKPTLRRFRREAISSGSWR